MPWKPPPAEVCNRSGKKVYLNDNAQRIGGLVFLPEHFTCIASGIKLTMETAIVKDGEVYHPTKVPVDDAAAGVHRKLLPGGYVIGDVVYATKSSSQKYYVAGDKGIVNGQADPPHEGTKVEVMWQTEYGELVDMPLDRISKSKLADLPGGYVIGDVVYATKDSSQKNYVVGDKAVVTGQADPPHEGTKVEVRWELSGRRHDMSLDRISKSKLAELPGGRSVGGQSKVNSTWPDSQAGKESDSCPSGHPLKSMTAPKWGPMYHCDQCQREVERKKPLHSCRKCDYDLCSSCHTRSNGAGAVFTITGATGRKASNINGSYRQSTELMNGALVYDKIGDAKRCCYLGPCKRWWISHARDKASNASSGYAHTTTRDLTAPEREEGPSWKVSLGDGVWAQQETVVVKASEADLGMQSVKYKAIYNYEAADDDEVSFKENDIICSAVLVDNGWMTGTVERTGESGMLPANYFVRAEVRSRRQSGLPSCLSPDSVPPSNPTQAEVKDRGPCTVCCKSVMTNEPRWAHDNGNYQHKACGEPTADSVHDTNKRCQQKEAAFKSACLHHESWCRAKRPALLTKDYRDFDPKKLDGMLREHESFERSMLVEEDAVYAIGVLANEIDDLSYVNADAINTRYANIHGHWMEMLEMAKVRTATLNTAWLEASEKKTKEMEERGPWTALTAPSMPTVAAKPSKEKRRRFMKLKRDKADALDICATDIRAYTQMWEGTLKYETMDLIELENEVSKIKSKMPVEEPRQPTKIDGESNTKTSDYLFNLNEAFEDKDDTIFTDVKAVAKEQKRKFVKGPDKNDDRALEKGKLAYGDDYSRLKDLRRASIICPNIKAIILLLLALIAAGVDICRIKNRFDRKYNATEMSAGYRDLQLNIRIPNTELIWELQLHLESIEELKSNLCDDEDDTGRTGHQRYVAFRTIMERLAIELKTCC